MLKYTATFQSEAEIDFKTGEETELEDGRMNAYGIQNVNPIRLIPKDFHCGDI